MTQTEQPARLEISTIQQIPLDQRHGTASDLFTVWFGSNVMLLTIVTGGLAVTVFGLPFLSAVVALAVGNLVGGVFMALHAAQGPTLGVPQMIQTRGAVRLHRVLIGGGYCHSHVRRLSGLESGAVRSGDGEHGAGLFGHTRHSGGGHFGGDRGDLWL